MSIHISKHTSCQRSIHRHKPYSLKIHEHYLLIVFKYFENEVGLLPQCKKQQLLKKFTTVVYSSYFKIKSTLDSKKQYIF